MNNNSIAMLGLALGAALCCSGQERSQAAASAYPKMAPLAKYLMPDRNAEIALARSAAPPSISADAAVLVLGRHGYDVAVNGRNGFVCLVERSWASPFHDPEFWNPKERGPNCFNPPAARTELPWYLKQTQWVLAGLTEQQVMAKTKAAVAGGSFKPPEAGAFSYMMSKQGYLGDAVGGPWYPHMMFFVQPGQGESWGANKKGSPVVAQDRELESTIFFVLVRTWSDGSPPPQPVARHKM